MATSQGTTQVATADVVRPVMVHDWRDVTFLHWAYDAGLVQQQLPPGLTVDTFDGRAWVGLVPFVLSVWTAGGGLGSRFPETNVRTYVRGPDGVPGVWFLSLDASRSDAVVAARLTHRLPYMRAAMQVESDGLQVAYSSRRRWPHVPAGIEAVIRREAAIPASVTTDQDRFLTDRHCLYTVVAGRLRRAWAAHAPWPLHGAEVVHLHEDLVAAAGLPSPAGPPISHYSPGVSVRIGRLDRVTGGGPR